MIRGVDLHSLKDDERHRFRALNMGFVFVSSTIYTLLNAVENVDLPCLQWDTQPKKSSESDMEILAKRISWSEWPYLHLD
jgi:putative ABC transport system ATP-binding protein